MLFFSAMDPLYCLFKVNSYARSSVPFKIYRLQIRFQITSLQYSARIFLCHALSRVFTAVYSQKISVQNFGVQKFGRQIWVGAASSTNIVRLPCRCAETVSVSMNVIATDASRKGNTEWGLITCSYKLAPWLAVVLNFFSWLSSLGGFERNSGWIGLRFFACDILKP